MGRKLKLQELNRINVDEFKAAEKTPIIVILDNIRSFNNVGSVFRTADCFRIEKVFLCGITAQPPHREIHKTAIGATESVEWEYAESTMDVISKLKKEGWKTFAIEQTESSVMLNDFQPGDDKIAIVMGNEVEGVDQAVINDCDAVIEIPQIGTKHSLNISVCTGLVLWDLYSKIRLNKA